MTAVSSRVLEKRIGAKVHPSPRVSVVIPAYNVAPFIAETLDSVLAQTFRDYEIVVVNDGSPDTAALEQQLTGYFDAIVYLRQANGGAARARNTGIEHARGDLIAFLDGDDVWRPEYLREQIEYLDAGGLEMVYANALMFGAVRTPNETYMDKAPSDGPADCAAIVRGRCNVVTSGTIVSRQRVLEVGLFDSSLPRIGMEDFDLWLRLAKAGTRIGYQRKVLLHYRVSPNSLSGNSIQRAYRTVAALKSVKERLSFTPREERDWREALDLAEAELLLETGKAHLLREEFGEAKHKFRAANVHYKNAKLTLVDWALTIAPRTVVRLFKKQRAYELPFIPASIDDLSAFGDTRRAGERLQDV